MADDKQNPEKPISAEELIASQTPAQRVVGDTSVSDNIGKEAALTKFALRRKHVDEANPGRVKPPSMDDPLNEDLQFVERMKQEALQSSMLARNISGSISPEMLQVAHMQMLQDMTDPLANQQDLKIKPKKSHKPNPKDPKVNQLDDDANLPKIFGTDLEKIHQVSWNLAAERSMASPFSDAGNAALIEASQGKGDYKVTDLKTLALIKSIETSPETQKRMEGVVAKLHALGKGDDAKAQADLDSSAKEIKNSIETQMVSAKIGGNGAALLKIELDVGDQVHEQLKHYNELYQNQTANLVPDARPKGPAGLAKSS